MKLDVERRAEIVRLTRAQHTAADIAEQLGISTRTVIRHRREGGCAQPAPRPFTAAEIRLAESLLDDGASYGEVARTLGRHMAVIRIRFPERGWPQYRGGNLMQALNRRLGAI